MRLNPCLVEETELVSHADDQLESDFGCDWSSDPMEILMAKQEAEREELGEAMRSLKLKLWKSYKVH